MKKYALTMFLFALLTSPAWATTYYLAPASAGGSDSNNGLSASTPWLTPNHPLNCGDVITAALSSDYAAFVDDWGTVTCPGGNNVAWLICATFDGCKTMTSSGDAMRINKSYWGVQGWEADVSSGGASCFAAVPPSSAVIHHIIFANVIANGCQNNGINLYNLNGGGVDYFAAVGNIVYNAAQGASSCFSGISIYQPRNFDSSPGTHLYLAGNFSWGNIEPNPCFGIVPSDGEGIILDTIDGSQGGLSPPYSGQIVTDNNMLIGNGGRGFEIFNNRAGTPPFASVFVRHNTVWGNNRDLNQNGTYCGEMLIQFALNTQLSSNIASTNAAIGCGANTLYAYYVGFVDSSDIVSNNVGWSATGHYSGTNNGSSFAYGSGDLFGTNPGFSSPSVPGAPSCSGASSVPNCMAKMISNFTPSGVAAAYGYQIPLTTNVFDPVFPQWLCNVHLPAGLVTMGCASASSLPMAPTITNVTVQ